MRSPSRIAPALLLLFCALLFAPAEARADAVAITSGYFSAHAPSAGGSFRTYSYDFGGDNLSIRGVEPDATGRQSVAWGCVPSPCAAGSTFTVNHRGGLFTWLPSTALQFNGETFSGRGMGALNFVTGELPWPPVGESVITLTTHFTMTGAVHFEALNFNDNTWTQFFVADVIGSGVASIRLIRISNFYFIDTLTYTFQPQAAQTPEPATLVLLGSGLAGLVAGHRRRRSRRRATR